MIALTDGENTGRIQKAIYRCRGEPHVVNISYEGVNTRRLD
jgi:hypothetical protein